MEKLSLVSRIVAHLEKKPRLAFNLLCFLIVCVVVFTLRDMFNRGEVSIATNNKKDSLNILNLQSEVRHLRYEKDSSQTACNLIILKMKDAHITELQNLNRALLRKSTRLENEIDR